MTVEDEIHALNRARTFMQGVARSTAPKATQDEAFAILAGYPNAVQLEALYAAVGRVQAIERRLEEFEALEGPGVAEVSAYEARMLGRDDKAHRTPWALVDPGVDSTWLNKVRAGGARGWAVHKPCPPFVMGETVAFFANEEDARRAVGAVNAVERYWPSIEILQKHFHGGGKALAFLVHERLEAGRVVPATMKLLAGRDDLLREIAVALGLDPQTLSDGAATLPAAVRALVARAERAEARVAALEKVAAAARPVWYASEDLRAAIVRLDAAPAAGGPA